MWGIYSQFYILYNRQNFRKFNCFFGCPHDTYYYCCLHSLCNIYRWRFYNLWGNASSCCRTYAYFVHHNDLHRFTLHPYPLLRVGGLFGRSVHHHRYTNDSWRKKLLADHWWLLPGSYASLYWHNYSISVPVGSSEADKWKLMIWIKKDSIKSYQFLLSK